MRRWFELFFLVLIAMLGFVLIGCSDLNVRRDTVLADSIPTTLTLRWIPDVSRGVVKGDVKLAIFARDQYGLPVNGTLTIGSTLSQGTCPCMAAGSFVFPTVTISGGTALASGYSEAAVTITSGTCNAVFAVDVVSTSSGLTESTTLGIVADCP